MSANVFERRGMICLLGAVMWLILLSVGAVFAGTLTGTMEGDMVVNLNLKVNTASSPGTPDFITGDNGDAYIKDQLEVDGSVSVDGETFRVNATSNYCQVGT